MTAFWWHALAPNDHSLTVFWRLMLANDSHTWRYTGDRHPHMMLFWRLMFAIRRYFDVLYWRPTATLDGILTAYTGDRQRHMTVYWRLTSTPDGILTSHVCNRQPHMTVFWRHKLATESHDVSVAIEVSYVSLTTNPNWKQTPTEWTNGTGMG